MRREYVGALMLLALSLLVFSSLAQAQEKEPMMMGMGERPLMMMHKGPCGPEHEPFFLCCKEELGLTEDQVAKLKSIKLELKKEEIQRHAKIELAEIELNELLSAEEVDLTKVKAKIKEIESLRADGRFKEIQARVNAKKVLTPEQLKKWEQHKLKCKMSPKKEMPKCEEEMEHKMMKE